MAAGKKKSAKKKKSAGKLSWTDAMKQALENKRQPGGWPDQGKPRDSAVKKLPKNVY